MPKYSWIENMIITYLYSHKEMSGYDFIKYCKENDVNISAGSVYPILKRLIEKKIVKADSQGRKKIYTLINPENRNSAERSHIYLKNNINKIGTTISCSCDLIPTSLRDEVSSYLKTLCSTDWKNPEALKRLAEETRRFDENILKHISILEGGRS